MSTLGNALWITLIGMGLVFVVILLLWGGMALLVRLTQEKETPEQPAETSAVEVPPVQEDDSPEAAAAAVAVAIALEMQKKASQPVVRPASAADTGTTWQAAHRAGDLHRNGFAKKQVTR